MAVLLIDDLMGEFSNSYIDVTYADQHFEDHYNPDFTETWGGLSDNQKQQLLIQATSIIEQFRFVRSITRNTYEMHYSRVTGLVSFYPKDDEPIKYNYWQALSFPRNLDIDSTTGDPYIPENIMVAQAEQAIALKNLAGSTASTATSTKIMQGITREMVSIANQITRDISYQDPTSSNQNSTTTMITSTLSPIAYQLLSPYIIRGGKVYRA